MKNAGRNLAETVLDMLDEARGEVAILAGSGGNGGGGLCAARHLHNHGFQGWVVLDREAAALTGAARTQLEILQATGLEPVAPCLRHALAQAGEVLRRSQIVVDALIGYGLRGAPRGRTAELIDLCNQYAA